MPWPAGAIPAEVFEEERTVQLNGTTVALKHYAPTHTDSDISVHFAEADIFPRRRHLLEWLLSLYRLFNRRQH